MSADTDARHARGRAGEQQARQWLEARGMRCLAAGWRCRLGELDLVMQDDSTLVFVEVRSRRAGGLVGALDSVDTRKRDRFVRAARAWLMANPAAAALPARFDIVTLDGEQLDWIPDAFAARAW